MKKLKKAFWCVYVFLFVLIIGTFHTQSVWDGTSASQFHTGNGTESNPYVIMTEAQLAYFAEQINVGHTFAGEYLSLEADLDMTGSEWSVADGQIFSGTFSGNDHTIRLNSRFLYSISEEGTVDWLNLIAPEQLNTPLLCKENSGTIQNCRVRGDVYINPGDAALLCITNHNTGTVINSCGFGSVYGRGDDSDCYVGWISENDGIIKNCYTIMTLSGNAPGKYSSLYKGGITAKGEFENCHTGNNVKKYDESFIALLNQSLGVPGYIWTADDSNKNEGYPVITQCLAAVTQLTASSEPMFVFHSSSVNTSITCSESDCIIYYTLDGSDPKVSTTRKKYDNYSSLTLIEDTAITTVAYKDGVYGVPVTQYAVQLPGAGTYTDPYMIYSDWDLYAIRFEPDKVYELADDLDFSDGIFVHNGIITNYWEPIPEFSGTLKGERYSITGLASDKGGFIVNNTGVIQELRLLKHQLHSRDIDNYPQDFGPIAHNNSGTITRCYAGFDPDVSVVTNVYSNGVGGIVGYNTGTISYCYSSGKIEVYSYDRWSSPYLAGIAGTNRGIIQNCYSDARIYMCQTSHDLGAIIGGISVYGTVENCRFDGYCEIPAGTASFGVGAAAFAGNRSSSYRCYDGGAVFSSIGRIYYTEETDLYKTTYSAYDLLETSFPKFDFESVWMITDDGPMPQGIMNPDGNYYTKKSYTAPENYKTGETVCYVNGTDIVTTFKLSASGEVTLSPETSEEIVGKTVYVDIIADASFSAAELSLSYDVSHLMFNQSASTLNGAYVSNMDGMLTIADFGESKTSYHLAFDTLASGTAEIKLTSAAFGVSDDAASEDLIPVSIVTDSVTIIIHEPEQNVVLPDILSGTSSVEYGGNYIFSLIGDWQYYDYTISAVMAGIDVPVIFNGDGTYTIQNVTGELVISAERTPKEFYVIFESSTGVELPFKTASVYGCDYIFEIPTKEHYSTSVTQIVYLSDQSNVPFTCENGIVTILGQNIIDNIKIVVDQELIDATVTVEGNGAGDVENYEMYVPGGKTYTLSVAEDNKYDYVVTALINGISVELIESVGTYTINAEDVKPGTIIFTVTKTIKLDAVTVNEYLTLDGNKLWIITNTVTELDGMVYCYDGTNMFWSDTYKAYCMIVASPEKPEVTVDNFCLVSGEVVELPEDLDINVSGNIDANDAQFVYNMYNGKYSGITEVVTAEKYLRADTNRDGVVNTQDAASVVNHILTRNAPKLFSIGSEEPSFHFILEADGSSEKYVHQGDIINFTFRIKRTDCIEDYIMYAVQNEIRYDSMLLELVENSITVYENVTTTDIQYSKHERELYMNYLAKSKDDLWPADILVGSFQMKVIGTSGVVTVSCQDCSMSREGGNGSYPITYSNVTLEIIDKQTVLGDVNGDGNVSMDDVLYFLRYTILPERYSLSVENVDYNCDGTVDTKDVVNLFYNVTRP